MPFARSRLRSASAGPLLAGLILAVGVARSALASDAADDSLSKPAPAPVARPGEPRPWVIAHRAISQGRDRSRYWQVDYLLRNDGSAPRSVRPEEIEARVEGSVSNSRVPGHARPRPSRLAISGPSGLSASCDILPSDDDSRRCRERGVLQVWAAEKGPEPPDPVAKAAVRLVALSEQPTWTIPPGGALHVRLRLEHDHFLYGPYDALLGPRTLTLVLGDGRVIDTLDLNHETPLPRPGSGSSSGSWIGLNEPPADRLDRRVYASAPDSLHLEAHIPGNASYQFKECHVRYGTRMRLSYRYLIASGTEGEAKARIVQYRDAPTAWKMLGDGEVVQCLPTVGRWVKVEKVFRTESEATSLTLEFKLCGDIGEMWIDDLSLEPVEDDPAGP